MFAIYADSVSATAPFAGLVLGEREEPAVPEGWVVVEVRAASLNHHDLWSLRGVGLPEDRLPMTLGCDASGVDQDGREVVVHSVISSPGWTGDETEDPRRSLLSEKYQGTLAERVAVPAANVVPKPASLSFEEAACLPTAWLTAYRMLFVKSGLQPGSTLLVQGAGGGVATALVALGAAAGFRMWVTSRDPAKGERALEIGADRAFASGERLPERVDGVMETVGKATWKHSIRSLRPGGTVVTCGATSGQVAETELARVFFLQMRILGSTMGTRQELGRLLSLCDTTGVRPLIDDVMPMSEGERALRRLAEGDVFGKLVLTAG
jgi:NADPH:quinone reductase-like Zn-dependent oxidoreductase